MADQTNARGCFVGLLLGAILGLVVGGWSGYQIGGQAAIDQLIQRGLITRTH